MNAMCDLTNQQAYDYYDELTEQSAKDYWLDFLKARADRGFPGAKAYVDKIEWYNNKDQ
ncbi:hypothetical protein [Psychrobacter sp. WY6]|uniref:hypothetical protein n=1 Tax=Psychrobacter sp. WY6 TaxID=2708350 RepID=UPI002022C7F8|nr:hypothetical protein [Psychrobacter sp. WY6]